MATQTDLDGTPRSRWREAFRWYLSTWPRPSLTLRSLAFVGIAVGFPVVGSFAREAAAAGLAWREVFLGWSLRAAPLAVLLVALVAWELKKEADRRPARVAGTLLAVLGLLVAFAAGVVRVRAPDLGGALLGVGVALLGAGPIGSKAPQWQAVAWAAACLSIAAWLALA